MDREDDRPNGTERPVGGGEVTVGAFATGGRVRETGIALVHEGEYILPAPGAEAGLDPATLAAGSAPTEVRYSFPVRVVYAGGLRDDERRALEEGIWEQLLEALQRMD